jgi:hypothetical protein
MAKQIKDSVQIDGTIEASNFIGSGASLTDIAQTSTLAGLDTGTSGTVAPTDTVVVAISKLAHSVATGGGGTGSDAFYSHNQPVASNVWTITHNLNKYPSVTITDSANNVIVGDVSYVDTNQLTVTFGSSFGGKAYLN